MLRSIILFLFIASSMPGTCQSTGNVTESKKEIIEDSLVWQTAISFSIVFDAGDTAAMNRLLPNDFILQWMHENFIGKKELINAMANPATREAMGHKVEYDEKAILRYSNDHTAASINTAFTFIDAEQTKFIEKSHGFGLCIIYLQKQNDKWIIRTVHLDLHCSLCNL